MAERKYGLTEFRGWLTGQFNWFVLLLVLAVEAVFVTLHVVTGALMPKIPHLLNISQDGSASEWFGYAVMAASAVIMFRAYRRERVALYLTFAVVLVTMVLDDSLTIHESLGRYFSEWDYLDRLPGPLAKDSGELVAWGAIALFLAPWGIYGLVKTPPRQWPSIFILTGLVGLLGFFAVGIDFLHEPICAAFDHAGYCFQIFDLVEDGGEMLAQALILAHVFERFAATPDTDARAPVADAG
ncbi:hypothetical protein P7228_04530 [Altererythrobacter arenosus]|uniref:Uncharacterized protein n=1 Tax=Altererythrobacter arenosus TaxID=3032592 RepID=A0ABY8FW94_9SPHN|nr:hypothetical protein [Altererythrobacter sp. CAU 1644]WFL78335.1 hypothetical protein P7228_04530 [Altererythrobacter sp. CAU 1644]